MRHAHSLLGMNIEIETDCELYYQRLGDIVVKAPQEQLVSGTFEFHVSRNGNGYRFLYENTRRDVAHLEAAIIFSLGLTHSRVLRRLEDYLWIHCGCAEIETKRFILVGAEDVGKTTLACKMLLSGIAVQTDEAVLVKNSWTVPFPRRFIVQEETVEILPELADSLKNSSLYHIGEDREYLIDPIDLGRSWSLNKAPLHTIFSIEANHGGDTTVETADKTEIIQSIMRQADNYSANPERQIENLCDIVNRCRCYTLRLGNLDRAVEQIYLYLR